MIFFEYHHTNKRESEVMTIFGLNSLAIPWEVKGILDKFMCFETWKDGEKIDIKTPFFPFRRKRASSTS